MSDSCHDTSETTSLCDWGFGDRREVSTTSTLPSYHSTDISKGEQVSQTVDVVPRGTCRSEIPKYLRPGSWLESEHGASTTRIEVRHYVFQSVCAICVQKQVKHPQGRVSYFPRQ